jgi:hypothetical protein
MSPVGLGIKTRCAGEDQQQFSRQEEIQNFQLIQRPQTIYEPTVFKQGCKPICGVKSKSMPKLFSCSTVRNLDNS